MPDYKSDALAFTRNGAPYGSNMPNQYKDSVQRQYLGGRTKAMLKRSKIACDYVGADVQGLQEDDFYAYTPKKIRLADAKALSSVSPKKADDFKDMLIDDPNVDYVPMGAKVVTMGSTFLAVNPYNLSGALPKTLLVRCNTAFNYYDDYGNVCSEPIYITKDLMLGSESEHLKNVMMMNGYFNVVCQLNAVTQKLDINQRICLGTKIYHVTGFNDFIQEFTADRSSVRLLSFSVYLEEPTQYDDVTENFIANGRNYSFGIDADGAKKLYVGTPVAITPKFIVNGKVSPASVTWQCSTSNKEIVDAQPSGGGILLDPIAEGNAAIDMWIEENPNVRESISVLVQSGNGLFVEFLDAVPSSIVQYSTETLSVKLYANGTEPPDAAYSIALSGASAKTYSAQYVPGSNTISISCLYPSDDPLVVTAKGTCALGEATATATINLMGY